MSFIFVIKIKIKISLALNLATSTKTMVRYLDIRKYSDILFHFSFNP